MDSGQAIDTSINLVFPAETRMRREPGSFRDLLSTVPGDYSAASSGASSIGATASAGDALFAGFFAAFDFGAAFFFFFGAAFFIGAEPLSAVEESDSAPSAVFDFFLAADFFADELANAAIEAFEVAAEG